MHFGQTTSTTGSQLQSRIEVWILPITDKHNQLVSLNHEKFPQ